MASLRSRVMRDRTFAGPVPGRDQIASTFDANACNGSSLALMVAARGCGRTCGVGGCSAWAAVASRSVQRIISRVHMQCTATQELVRRVRCPRNAGHFAMQMLIRGVVHSLQLKESSRARSGD